MKQEVNTWQYFQLKYLKVIEIGPLTQDSNSKKKINKNDFHRIFSYQMSSLKCQIIIHSCIQSFYNKIKCLSLRSTKSYRILKKNLKFDFYLDGGIQSSTCNNKITQFKKYISEHNKTITH